MLRPTRSHVFALVCAGFLAASTASAFQGGKPAKAKDVAAPAVGEHVETLEALEALGLTLRVPAAFGALAPLTEEEKNAQIQVGWHARAGASALEILLFALPRTEYGFEEPEDVTDFLLDDFREQHDASFAFAKTELVNGAFGFAPYAAIAIGPMHGPDGKTVTGTCAVAAGLLETQGYSLEIHAEPALDAAGEKLVLDFLRKGVAYKGPTRNAQWTDDEVRARWEKDAPPELAKKLEKPVRTKHYVFLSNTDAEKQMGDAMETTYALIQDTYHFP